MKKVKFLCIIFCLVMTIGVVSAWAAEGTTAKTQYIREVNIHNVAAPVPGKMWQGDTLTASSDAPYRVHGMVEWIDETEDRFMKNNEKFQVGHVYTVQVWVEAKDGYEFDSTPTEYNMKGYFYPGGKPVEAKLSKAFEYQRWAMVVMSYTFPKLEALEKIEYIGISDVVEPKIGRQSIAREQYLRYGDNVEAIDAYWMENYDWDNRFTGIFAEQKRYTFVVKFAAKEGYYFAYPDDIVVSINGRVAEARIGNDGTLLVLYDYKTGKAPKRVMGIVTFNIDAPAIGAHPSFEAKDNRNDGLYYIDKQHQNSTKNGIIWYEGVGDNQRKMAETDTFKAGENYYVAIRVRPIQEYEFDTDENGDLLVSGAINGNTAIIGGNAESLFVGYAFYPLEEEKKESAFTDVSESDYFFDAVMWAKDTGLTVGTTATTFSPYDTCTRAQGITFLWRAAGKPAPKNKTNPFTDVKKTDYFYEAVLWGVEEGIIVGTSKTTFTPHQTCSSAHIMTMLYRAMKIGTNGWYEDARNWANSEGLLDGTSFVVSPDEPCPRAGIAYFLYMFYKK